MLKSKHLGMIKYIETRKNGATDLSSILNLPLPNKELLPDKG